MIYLAFDGSVNSDWLLHYGIYFAKSSGRPITLLHVLGGTALSEEINSKILHAEKLCRKKSIECRIRIIPLRGNAADSIASEIESTSDNLCICGTRIRSPGRGILSGTVSEQLLRMNRFPVLVLRVVHPGILGSPDRLLLAVSDRPDVYEKLKKVLNLFLLNAKEAHLLHIAVFSALKMMLFGRTASARKKKNGLFHIKHVAEKIRSGFPDLKIDSRVVVSENWPDEILIHAAKLKANFILMGATERSAARRIFNSSRFEKILRETPCDAGIFRNV